MAKGPSLNLEIFNVNLGECLFRSGRENSRMWKYSRFPRRNREDCLMHAQLCWNRCGCIWCKRSLTSTHEVLQIPDMILFDYIQPQVLEGECTRWLSKWLHGICPNKIAINCAAQAILSKVVHNVEIPHDFKWKFRPVQEFNRWKASEKEVLFLHVGLPILK